MAEKALQIIQMNDPARYGLEPDILCVGDTLAEVSGKPARDQLDFHYYTSHEVSGTTLHLVVKRKDGRLEDIHIDANILQKLKLVFSPMDFRRCRCKCPFCFVDQMPDGMRPQLYFKDEDFRLSFIYGNFTTMNDITGAEIKRVIEQGISPQYVSVHAVDEKTREWIFGRPMKRNIIEILRALAEGGITIHTQAVLCPGKNDGACLEDTISTLEALHSNIASLAVVPVGLTRHRKGLPEIRLNNIEEMHRVIDQVEAYQSMFLRHRRKGRFVFASDEWYIEANREIPGYNAYEAFPQLDNGVGMARRFLHEIEEDIDHFGAPGCLDRVGIVTGKMGERLFKKHILPVLSKHTDGLPRILAVKNRFFGEMVTCSGLLAFEDIAKTLKDPKVKEKIILLPPNVLNYEGMFLDGPTLDDLQKTVSPRIIVPEDTLIGALNQIGTPKG